MPMLILIVEDNNMNSDLFTSRLKKKGYAVQVATNGKTALADAERLRPHLIMLDMNIPVLDGWATARALKSNPELAGIPIIAVTAHALEGERERCLEAGCDDYLSKPIKFQILYEKIMHHLNRANHDHTTAR
ncbi:MAG: response regulator [Phototrophicaceae bacterium]